LSTKKLKFLKEYILPDTKIEVSTSATAKDVSSLL